MATALLESKIRGLLVDTRVMDLLSTTGLKAPLSGAWRHARKPQLVRERLDVLRDHLVFRLKYGFLSEGAGMADPAKRVVVVSLTDWIAQAKAEGMLAKALQLQGYTPVILTKSSCRNAIRYFKVFGYDHFVYLDELSQAAPVDEITSEAQSILNQSLSFSSLMGLRYRGVNIGKHVLSTVVRKLLHGSVEFSDPRVNDMLQSLLPASMQSVWAAEQVMDRVRPQTALLLEKGYSPFGEVFDVAVDRGVDCIQWPHSHRSDAFALKRYSADNRSIHPYSLSTETWEMVQQMPWTDERESALMHELKGRYEQGTWFNRKFLQVGKELKRPDQVKSQLGLDPGKKTAVIFSHVLWDATFFYGENLFDDYEHWLVETVKVACENTAVNWVIKLHPDYVWKMKQMGDGARPRDILALNASIGQLPGHISVMEPETDISTYSLFHVTDYCLTARGTVGIEMPCFGVPVFTAGTGRYSGLGFTIDSHSREDYLAKLQAIQQFPPLTAGQTLLARKHAYALFTLRPCPFKTFEMVQTGLDRLGHPLDHNVTIRAKSLQDITDAPDLGAFASWVADSKQEDFLMPAMDSYLLALK